MKEIKKLVITNNDGLRQSILVFVRDNQVISAAHCRIAGKQYHALQVISQLFDDEVLELELRGKIKEGYLVVPELFNIDFLPKNTRKIAENLYEEQEADFWWE